MEWKKQSPKGEKQKKCQDISERGSQENDNASDSEDKQANGGEMVLEKISLIKMKVMQ